MIAIRALTALAAGAAAVVLAAPLAAAPPVAGSGSGTIVVRDVTTIRQADGNVIQERTLEGALTGTLTGTFVEHVRGVIHKSGSVTFHGVMTFTGSVAGCGSGTVVLGVNGRGVAGAPTTEGRLRTIAHSRSTLDVHGVGTFQQVGPSLTYEARLQCG
jgi:hypothetical protein